MSEALGWTFSTVDLDDTTMTSSGLRRAVAEISGSRAYDRLKFEAGVHRVQRVPVTDHRGRMHTSTASLAVLPKIRSEAIRIDPKDLRVKLYILRLNVILKQIRYVLTTFEQFSILLRFSVERSGIKT